MATQNLDPRMHNRWLGALFRDLHDRVWCLTSTDRHGDGCWFVRLHTTDTAAYLTYEADAFVAALERGDFTEA